MADGRGVRGRGDRPRGVRGGPGDTVHDTDRCEEPGGARLLRGLTLRTV